MSEEIIHFLRGGIAEATFIFTFHLSETLDCREVRSLLPGAGPPGQEPNPARVLTRRLGHSQGHPRTTRATVCYHHPHRWVGARAAASFAGHSLITPLPREIARQNLPDRCPWCGAASPVPIVFGLPEGDLMNSQIGVR